MTRAYDAYAALTGRSYAPVRSYRTSDAAVVLVGLGSALETAEAVVDHLRDAGLAAGAVTVTQFRPFPGPALLHALRGAKDVAVLERVDDPLAAANPLAREVMAVLYDGERRGDLRGAPRVHQALGGLGGKDITPADLAALFREAARGEAARRVSVLGAEHRLRLRPEPVPDLRPPGSFTLRGHAVGGMGAMAANRVMATTVAEAFGLAVQAYPQFGAEKRGLPTAYFLTAGPERLRLHCQSDRVDFVAIHDPLALGDPRTLDGLSRRGFLFVATLAGGPPETWEALPSQVRERAAKDRLTVVALNVAMAVPELRMQGMAFLGVFLRYAPFRAALAPGEDALWAAVERALARQFASKGRPVVDANLEGARRGFEGVWELMREGERL